MKHIICPLCNGRIEYTFEIKGIQVPWLTVCQKQCSEVCSPYQGMIWKEYCRVRILPTAHLIFDGKTYMIELDIDPKNQTIPYIPYSQFSSWGQLFNREWFSGQVNALKLQAEKLALLV